MFENFTPKVSIIGLWYVWLPLAHAFVKEGIDVVGFDINQVRLEELKKGIDSTNEIQWEEIVHLNKIKYTSQWEDLKDCNFFIVTVPTPIDQYKKPNLTPVIKATENIAQYIQKGSIIVYESTVFPGVTEDICLPIIEKISGLKYWEDFKLGYSPERINPGDKEHTVTKILKVVSGSDQEGLHIIDNVYNQVIKAGTFKAANIKTAEAAKVIENTQRDINIALINELSLIFERIGINTYDVLEAAGTKWNFLKFTPGLVWGHCIGVDPYYLVQKAEELGYHPEVITAWRRINDNMGTFIANQLVKQLIKSDFNVKWAKVLILWLTFKENVPDFRNSKVCDVIKELKDFWVSIEWYDPYSESLNEYTLNELNLEKWEIITDLWNNYDAIIYATDHSDFSGINFNSLRKENWVIFDVKGKFRNNNLVNYRSL